MRISAFRALASSLAFNSAAVASVCKPRSSAPIPLSLSTSEAFSSTLIPSSTTVLTYDASAVSLGTTTSEVVVSTDGSSSTEKDTAESATSIETLSTTAVAPDSSITTTEVPTSAFTATSSATTSDAALPSFIISPFRPPFNGQPMLSNRVTGNLLFLSVVNKPEYTAGVFTIDPESGHLLLDNKQPICAIYGQDDSNPWLEVCPRFLAEEEVTITCQIVDSELECKIPAVYCSSNSGDVYCSRLGYDHDYLAPDCSDGSGSCGVRAGDFRINDMTAMLITYQ
ncbi:hypothetical protein NXS19_004714 [Fusarium pseudograminearum]|nr:hypothetical protein NXS19_004714 [Fusarium pseudograminearum]